VLPILKTDNPFQDNKKIVGIFFSRNLAEISSLFNNPENTKIKSIMEKTRKLLLAGETKKLSDQMPKLLEESRIVLTKLTPAYWRRTSVVSVAFDHRHTFVFLASLSQPKFFVSFWFDANGKNDAILQRIDFFRYDFSFGAVDKLAREAGMKRFKSIYANQEKQATHHRSEADYE
jgi:hypothetical protein